MSEKDFAPARSLLPQLLAKLARESGRGAHLGPLWEEIVGAVTARHTRPLRLEGATLQVEVESPRWGEAVRQQAPEILARLRARLGEGAVTSLVLHTVEPK